jgi:hypothetical protein
MPVLKLDQSFIFQDCAVLDLRGKALIGMVCVAALFALASPAGAATALATLDTLPSAPIAVPASSLLPETQPYRPLFPIEDDDLAGFIAHATTNVSNSETPAWVKMLMGFAGLGFLLRRRVWWRNAAYVCFDQRNRAESVQRQS